MSSEQLADGVNPLDAELAATWDVLKGYSGRDTDLGIARRFGGSSAAYSLRDIGATNGRVVRVRREPNDTTAAIDDEENFSANQVQSGTLEDWVNGKLESTLPADVDTATAAYSLRKVKATYSGNAVRIRRSSDDVEVDVAFDSDDKVSASSAITNIAEQGGESGSTTATDLNGFLNETLTVGVAVEGGSGADRPDSFTNATNSSFTATVTEVAGGYFPYTTGAGDVITISFDLVLSGASPSACTSTSVSTVNSASNTILYTASGSYTSSFTCTADATHFRFADGDDGTFAVTNFQVTSHTHQAFVHTWYDQAGSNNAVQETDANQPKIAENGALLADGIDFDGSNDELRTSTNIASSQPVTVFSVTKPDAINKRIFESITNSVRAFYGSSSQTGMNAGNTLLGTTNEVSTNTEYLQTHLFNTTNSKVFLNNVERISGDAGSNAFAGNFSLGGSSAVFDGTMKELILYTSDQSDNRFKIESNINNYYGLYNDANDMATDWSDDPTAPYGSAFTSNGKDGYTIDYSAGVASTRARWQFANNVPSGEVIYYSFNASITSGTPAVILKQSDGTSNANSSSVLITSGFNSGSITTNAEAVYFAIGDTEGTQDYSISDFKVSRIARNGFVETWYDQSGNGEDMTQGTAGKQPSIILNGGQVKDYKGNNSIDFVSGSTRVLDKSGTTTAKTCIVVLDEDSSGSAERAILGFSDSTSFMRLDTGNDLEVKAGGVSANYRAVPTDVTSLYFWYTNGTDEDKLFANNVEEEDTLSGTPPNLPFTRIGARNSDSDPYNSRITEVIAFAEDLSADRTVLQDDINNYYTIY